jgi:hypothetical protein
MVEFTVNDIPPKEDGANSMWGKPAEIARLKSLRKEAYRALRGTMPDATRLTLTLHVHADVAAGDLDNFITGICDGLQAAHRQTPIDESAWSDVPSELHPRKPIAFCDDACIFRILAERHVQLSSGPRYEVQLGW